MHVMAEAERDVAFVVDEAEWLLGIVTAKRVEQAAHDCHPTLAQVLEQAPMVVPVEWSLELLSRAVMDYDWKVDVLPVVGAQGELVGEVHRATVRSLAAESAQQASAFRPRGEGPQPVQNAIPSK
jgi:Mg/Co/Ni transporter MgtE